MKKDILFISICFIAAFFAVLIILGLLTCVGIHFGDDEGFAYIISFQVALFVVLAIVFAEVEKIREEIGKK